MLGIVTKARLLSSARKQRHKQVGTVPCDQGIRSRVPGAVNTEQIVSGQEGVTQAS